MSNNTENTHTSKLKTKRKYQAPKKLNIGERRKSREILGFQEKKEFSPQMTKAIMFICAQNCLI